MLDHHLFQISQLGSTFIAPIGWHKGECSSYNSDLSSFLAGFHQIVNTILRQFCCFITRGITADHVYEYLELLNMQIIADMYTH